MSVSEVGGAHRPTQEAAEGGGPCKQEAGREWRARREGSQSSWQEKARRSRGLFAALQSEPMRSMTICDADGSAGSASFHDGAVVWLKSETSRTEVAVDARSVGTYVSAMPVVWGQ